MRSAREGEDTGRLHLQFMVQFDRSKRLNGVRVISEQAHWEPVHGSTIQCKAYVTKEATRVAGPWEYGALAAAGKRRGLDEAVDSVKAGVPLHEVAAEYFGLGIARQGIDIPSPDAQARCRSPLLRP